MASRAGGSAKLSHLDGVTLRVNEDVRKTVIFFGVPGPDGIEYGGTGFLLADFDNGILMPFLVTARHVAKTLEEYSDTGFFIRMNRRDGESEPVPVNSIKWAYHPNKQVDVAATYFSIPINEYDAVYYPLRDSCFTTEDRIATYEHPDDIRCGDPISIVGLFRLHAGSKRNVPIVHNGHIAALPDPREKIPLIKRGTDDLIEVEGYLVEAQTLEGLSGSLVFTNECIQINSVGKYHGQWPSAYGALVLLGLYVGAWDGRPGEILAKDRSLKGETRIPVGMASLCQHKGFWR